MKDVWNREIGRFERAIEPPKKLPISLFQNKERDGGAGLRLAGGRIQDDAAVVAAMTDLEHPVDRDRDGVERLVADQAERPVFFDELEDRRLVGDAVVDEVLFGEGRDDEQR